MGTPQIAPPQIPSLRGHPLGDAGDTPAPLGVCWPPVTARCISPDPELAPTKGPGCGEGVPVLSGKVPGKASVSFLLPRHQLVIWGRTPKNRGTKPRFCTRTPRSQLCNRARPPLGSWGDGGTQLGPPPYPLCYASPVLTQRIPLPARNHSFSPKCNIFQYRDFFSCDNEPPPFLMSPFLSSSSHPQQPRAAATKPTGNPLGYFPSCPAEISRSLPHAP